MGEARVCQLSGRREKGLLTIFELLHALLGTAGLQVLALQVRQQLRVPRQLQLATLLLRGDSSRRCCCEETVAFPEPLQHGLGV
eukprot:COSAG01_NODE_7757_length_3068_cov_7.706298_3_plen_84_part_00